MDAVAHLNSFVSLLTDWLENLSRIDVEWLIVGCFVVSWVMQMLLVWAQFSSGRRISRKLKQAKEEWAEKFGTLSGQLEQLQACENQSLAKLDVLSGPRPLADTPPPVPQGSRRLNVDKKHQVFGLARRGLDTGDIAKKLKLYQGETELMLNLRSYLSEQQADNG